MILAWTRTLGDGCISLKYRDVPPYMRYRTMVYIHASQRSFASTTVSSAKLNTRLLKLRMSRVRLIYHCFCSTVWDRLEGGAGGIEIDSPVSVLQCVFATLTIGEWPAVLALRRQPVLNPSSCTQLHCGNRIIRYHHSFSSHLRWHQSVSQPVLDVWLTSCDDRVPKVFIFRIIVAPRQRHY